VEESGRRRSAAGVKPANALFAEDVIPVDVAFFQVRNGGVATIVGAESGPHAETALSEIESIARGAADAVVLDPADEGLIRTPPW